MARKKYITPSGLANAESPNNVPTMTAFWRLSKEYSDKVTKNTNNGVSIPENTYFAFAPIDTNKSIGRPAANDGI